MLKRILALIIFLAFLVPVSPVVAAKSVAPVKVIKKEQNISLNANLNKKKNLVVSKFTHLKDVAKTDYTLTYTHNGIPQGVLGNMTPNGKAQVKTEIFLGTCSQKSCIKHNAKNIKLSLTTTYKSGKVVTTQIKVK